MYFEWEEKGCKNCLECKYGKLELEIDNCIGSYY